MNAVIGWILCHVFGWHKPYPRKHRYLLTVVMYRCSRPGCKAAIIP